MSPLAIGILLFFGLGLAAYTLFGHFDERSTVRASLRQIEGYDVITSIRERELLGSAKERIAGPLFDAVLRLAHRFTPQGYVEKSAITMDPQGHVLADMDGPGCVVRIWSANPNDAGKVRVYLDGAEEPVIEAPLQELLGGKWQTETAHSVTVPAASS